MKKKQKEKNIFRKQIFMLEADPYRQQCLIVVNGTFEDIEKEFNKHKGGAVDANLKYIEENRKELKDIKITNGVLFQTFPVGFAMILNVTDNWIETCGIVAHECLHLTNYIHRRTGMPLTEESEEAYTYLQQKCITKILRKIYC